MQWFSIILNETTSKHFTQLYLIFSCVLVTTKKRRRWQNMRCNEWNSIATTNLHTCIKIPVQCHIVRSFNLFLCTERKCVCVVCCGYFVNFIFHASHIHKRVQNAAKCRHCCKRACVSVALTAFFHK